MHFRLVGLNMNKFLPFPHGWWVLELKSNFSLTIFKHFSYKKNKIIILLDFYEQQLQIFEHILKWFQIKNNNVCSWFEPTNTIFFLWNSNRSHFLLWFNFFNLEGRIALHDNHYFSGRRFAYIVDCSLFKWPK